MNVFQSYFHHLAESPERIDSLLMWVVCTLVAWAMLYKYRKSILRGLEGENGWFEGGEIVTFVSFWLFPPIALRIAMFHEESSNTQMISLYIVAGIMAYQLTGRYIFDWALAIRTGGKIEPTKEPEKVVTTTTQNSPEGTKVETTVK